MTLENFSKGEEPLKRALGSCGLTGSKRFGTRVWGLVPFGVIRAFRAGYFHGCGMRGKGVIV